MDDELTRFLKRYRPLATQEVSWNQGEIRLRLESYCVQEIPPLSHVTSVRGIVLQGDEVLAVRYLDAFSILPGGRREEGEEIEETLRRELLEETGWVVGDIQLLGFQHYHHLTEKPLAYRYPYPDFLQLVYAAEASRCVSEVRQENGCDLECWFCPIGEVDALGLSAGERTFLAEAARRTC